MIQKNYLEEIVEAQERRNKHRGGGYHHIGFVEVLYMAGILTIIIAVGVRGWLVDDTIVPRTMRAAGWSDVTVTAVSRLFVSLQGCGSMDAAKFRVVGYSPSSQGKKIRSTAFVCVGWPFKGATIRY